jgi:hypothetical protein
MVLFTNFPSLLWYSNYLSPAPLSHVWLPVPAWSGN